MIDFTAAMLRRTDAELIQIVTLYREDYQPEAIVAAEEEIKRRNIDPAIVESVLKEVAEINEKQSQFNAQVVNSSARMLHWVIDTIAIILLAGILGVLVDFLVSLVTNDSDSSLKGFWILLVFPVAFFCYYIFMEYKFGKTIGKYITKTHLISVTGAPPTFVHIVKRTVCRIIGMRRLRIDYDGTTLHDELSETRVIKDSGKDIQV